MTAAPSHTALPWGYCRFNSNCSRRQRAKGENEPSIRIPCGPVWIRSPQGCFLCRLATGFCWEANCATTICYDSSISVDHEESLDWEQHFSNVFFLQSTKEQPDACQSDVHSHAQLLLPLLGEEESFDSDCILGTFKNPPLPLLSLQLKVSVKPPSTTTESPPLQNQPLLLACLKRQLAGCPLVCQQNDNGISTVIQLSLLDRKWTLRVESIIVQQKKDAANSSILYMVLPSTRITILEDDAKATLQDTYQECKTTITSPTARFLMETIHCIRQSTANLPRSFLLTSPPGAGKTYAVQVAVQQSQPCCELISIKGSELMGVSVSAAQALERHFDQAVRVCNKDERSVALIFLDECDALLSSEVVAAMLAVLLDRVSNDDPQWRRILVVSATNRIDSIPAHLRRPGRIDREIPLPPPNAKERKVILESMLQENSVQGLVITSQELEEIADACVGYVPADLAALVWRAAVLGMELENSNLITFDLLKQAMADVGASALRDAALSAPPTTTWHDIAGDPGGAKTALRQAIEWPRTKSRAYQVLGLTAPRGILLHGPPGCAKTTLARAAAGASGVAFLSLAPADVYASSYVGEAEAVVRRAFTLARSAAPCVLFFDEIDAVLGADGSRGGHGMDRGSSAEARVLSTFLNEMDGIDGSWKDGVLLLGATNRPWTLDAALLRPGRFDKIIYVPPPDYEGRRSILAMQCSHWDTGELIDIDSLADENVTGNMTGAEIVGACREASMKAIREAIKNGIAPHMKQPYLEETLQNVQPLLSNPKVMQEFEEFQRRRV